MERLEENKAFIEKTYGTECYIHKCDVSNPNDVRETVQDVFDHFGRIDVLVNNAGIRGGLPAAEMTDEQWLEVINTNLNGVYWFAREVGKHMIDANYGRIINISSMYGLVANKKAGTASYGAAKGGVVTLTKALACEWGKYGITVNAISPGYFPTELMAPWIDTDRYKGYFADRCPVGRKGEMEEANSTVLYLAAEESSYVTGVVIPMDGGWTAD
jgi:gluconate 5-dehydrogenase